MTVGTTKSRYFKYVMVLITTVTTTVDEGVQTLYFYDGDGDNFGISAVTSLGCEQPENYVLSSNDCNDSNDQIHPDMAETCNNIDDNCNFQADEDEVFWYYDQDGDGFGVEDAIVFDCAPPNASFVIESGDCNQLMVVFSQMLQKSVTEQTTIAMVVLILMQMKMATPILIVVGMTVMTTMLLPIPCLVVLKDRLPRYPSK